MREARLSCLGGQRVDPHPLQKKQERLLGVGVDPAGRWRMRGHSKHRRTLVPRDGGMLRECKHPKVTRAWNLELCAFRDTTDLQKSKEMSDTLGWGRRCRPMSQVT